MLILGKQLKWLNSFRKARKIQSPIISCISSYESKIGHYEESVRMKEHHKISKWRTNFTLYQDQLKNKSLNLIYLECSYFWTNDKCLLKQNADLEKTTWTVTVLSYEISQRPVHAAIGFWKTEDEHGKLRSLAQVCNTGEKRANRAAIRITITREHHEISRWLAVGLAYLIVARLRDKHHCERRPSKKKLRSPWVGGKTLSLEHSWSLKLPLASQTFTLGDIQALRASQRAPLSQGPRKSIGRFFSARTAPSDPLRK